MDIFKNVQKSKPKQLYKTKNFQFSVTNFSSEFRNLEHYGNKPIFDPLDLGDFLG